jgi:aminopeptidase N
MLRTDTPVTVYRKDYTPPAFAIDHVDLVLDLDPQRTVVTSTLKIQRTGAADAPLVLAGEELELVGVRLDGQPFSGVRQDGDSLTLTGLPGAGTLEITTACNPAANTTLSGLYVSNGNFFTQCEAEGFRRITYFLDRPDVMTTYRVTLRADAPQARCCCPTATCSRNAICRTAATKPSGKTRSASRHTCSRWWPASSSASRKPSFRHRASKSCCRSGSSRRTWTRRATRWTR